MEIDSDVVSSCKSKLLQFRIKELKEVLSHVGLSKQGKKQDLIDRILALLYDEGTPGLFKKNVNGKEDLVDFIDDAYRKMHETGCPDSNSKKQNSTSNSRSQPREETVESPQLERNIRCPCGSSGPGFGPLIQCLDPDCDVWQHSSCVITPQKPMEKITMPSLFLCEVCRLKRADPFWTTIAHPLHSVKLVSSSTPADGTNPLQNLESNFKLTRADRDLLQKEEYDVQAWCILFNDSVPFRVQWPQYADLQVNGIPVRTVNRPGSQLLGANGRDDCVKITMYIAEGVNKISISASDARVFCFGVRLVKRRTLQQVLGMIPKEPDGELFESALARVQRCIGGGMTTEKEDSDSDLEVIADSVTVNLRCPMSGSRMKTAGRFRPCIHMGCFDLYTFVELNERSRKWQCPICLKNYSVEDLIIDPFFNRMLDMMQNCAEEVNEIDMKPDGSWRVRNTREVGDLSQWHCPDLSNKTFYVSEVGPENVLETNAIQNNVADGNVHGTQGLLISLTNQKDNDVGQCEPNIITMSSSSSENGNNDENPSMNQAGGSPQFAGAYSHDDEVNSGVHNVGYGNDGQGSFPPDAHADVIVLSDSEDDDISFIEPETAYHDGFSLSASAKIFNSYPAVVAPSEGPCMFSENDINLKTESPFLSNSQGGSRIDFFGNSGAVVDGHNIASYSEPVDGMLTTEPSLDPVHHVMNSFVPEVASTSGNISLEVRPPCSSAPCNEIPLFGSSPSQDWISLGTETAGPEGSRSSAEVYHEPALDLQNQLRSEEDSLIQNAQGDSGSGSDLNVNERSDGPFSFPRQRRTERKRRYEAAFQGSDGNLSQ